VLEKINLKINRSKVSYAITLAKSLTSKDPAYINKIWALCGFKSKQEFDNNFKRIHGITFKDYVDKL
jgi:AraC-like DNA-binding protein